MGNKGTVTVVFTSDHAGYRLRRRLADKAKEIGVTVIEVGAPGEDSYDYPRAADEGVPMILSGQATFGVFICGSGIGICMRANRHPGIRAANCWSEESAKLARLHNNANVLCLGERLIEGPLAEKIMVAFLEGENDSAERHSRRVGMLDAPRDVE